MFLEILECGVENKKKCLWKTVLKMLSQICGKIVYLSTKLLLEKSAKKKIKQKVMRVSTIFGGFWGEKNYFF